MTAMRALLQVGGMKSTAKASSVLLLRDGGKGTTLVTTLDMKRILKGAQGDVPLKPFDVVYVPKSRITRVNEFVDRYIRQSMPVTTNFGFSYLLNGTIVGSTQ
jgi:polysaccharide export outer membrane protein